MKVLILTGYTDLPEAHCYVQLHQRGIEIELYGDPDSPHRDFMASHGIRVRDIKFSSRLSLSSVRALRRIFTEGKYDIVHYFSSRALSNGLIAATGLPMKHVAYRGTVGHLSRLDPSSWMTYLHPKLDRIICVSRAVERYLLTLGLPSEKVVTIYKGHDPAWYQRTPADLTEFGIPSDGFVVCCAANMRPVKGVDVLLRAAQLIPAEYNIHFLLVGEVRDPKITALAKDLERRGTVHFTGFRKDVSSLIGASQVFVMPSIAREGLPKAVIEAMSQGVTPIVTNVGGMPELVENRVSGLVVPPSDPTGLRDAIIELYQNNDLHRQLSEGARARITSDFGIISTVENTLGLYELLHDSLPERLNK